MSEVMQHNTPDSFWMVLKGAVYDITEFQHYHPGGAQSRLYDARMSIRALRSLGRRNWSE